MIPGARRIDRFAQFAVTAAEEALTQAGDLEVDPNRVTVNVASGIGGLESLEVLIDNAYQDDPRVSPLWIPMMMCNAAAAAISIRYGFGGQASTPVVACAAGAQAILDGLRQVEWGTPTSPWSAVPRRRSGSPPSRGSPPPGRCPRR